MWSMKTVIVSTDPVSRPQSVGWLWEIWVRDYFHIAHNTPCFSPKFCKVIVSSFSWISEAHAIFVGGKGPGEGGGGEGETRKVKGNMEEDKCICFVFRSDFVIIIIIIIIIIEINCFLIEMIF